MNLFDFSRLLLCVILMDLMSSVQSWNLIWSDDFNGPTIDKSKWIFENGDGCSSNNCGWGNNELEWYQEENAYIQNGNLVIEARRQNAGGKEYTSSKMITKGTGDWKFGKVEVRARLPVGQGIWPAIWMLPTDNVYGGWPRSGEIDIMELIGNQPSTVYMTAHYGERPDYKGSQGTQFTLPGGQFSDGFHVFSVEWQENQIRWLVDDSVKMTVNIDQVTSDRGFLYPFNERFYLILNVAVGGNWPGNPDGSTQFPLRMEVDYVRVYQ